MITLPLDGGAQPDATLINDLKLWRRTTQQWEEAVHRRQSVISDARLMHAQAQRTFESARRAYETIRPAYASSPGAEPVAFDSYAGADSDVVASDVGPETPSHYDTIAVARAVADNIVDNLIVLDTIGRITYVNSAAAGLLGFGLEDRGGRVFEPLLRWTDDQASPNTLSFGDEGQGSAVSIPRSGEIHGRGGKWLNIQGILTPIVVDGRTRGATMVFRVTSAHRRAPKGTTSTPHGVACALARNGKLAERLTPKELDIISLLGAGVSSDRELTERLVVTQNTIKYHFRNIFGKLGVSNRAQVVAYALNHGLVDG